MFIGLIKNVAAGTRSALFMPVQLWSFQSGFIQVALLLLLSFALTFLHDYVDTWPHHVFNPFGLSYQGLLYFLFFFSLALLARINGRWHDADKLAVMFLSVVPVIWLGTLCLYFLFEQQQLLDAYQTSWLVFSIYSLWYLLVAFRLFKRFFYLPTVPAVACVLFYAGINFLPLFTVPAAPLWQATSLAVGHANVEKPIDIETIYYQQSPLLDATRARIYPGNKDTTDVYFIGFAGHADEDVFMNEARQAERIVNLHYNSHGRSALLINNKKTVHRYPLANQHNLDILLQDLGSKMDSEDILFLFITSHGNEEHEISTDFYPFKLNSLTPSSLHNMLANSGIKWRILVVSACFSGGFIQELADPNTLLITAARHDRNSFGCGHNGDYTFFGEAFFEQGLKQGLTLGAAFAKALSIVSEREDEQGYEHSEPQMVIGEEMADKLADYEAERQKMQPGNWARTKLDSVN